MKQINTNSSVHFRLTRYGKTLLQNDEEFRIFSHRIGKDYEMQIHEFARIVGPHMILGMDNVIRHNLIYIDDYNMEERDITKSLEPDE